MCVCVRVYVNVCESVYVYGVLKHILRDEGVGMLWSKVFYILMPYPCP